MRDRALWGRLLAGVVLGLALAGCGDPSVRVEIVVPPEYSDRVPQISLETLAPKPDKSFRCDTASFQLVDPAAREAALEGERVLRETRPQSIGAVPRNGRKLFWVEGRTEDDLVALLGCGELDAVDGDADVTIDLQPVRVPAIEGETTIPADFLLDAPLRVRAADIFGAPLGEVAIRWRAQGVGGAVRTGSAASDQSGVAEIPLPPADGNGPIALDVYTQWAQDFGRRVGGFRQPAPRSFELPFYVLQAFAGRFGANGAPALALIGLEYAVGAYKVAVRVCSFVSGGEVPFSCEAISGLPFASSVSAAKLERPLAPLDALAILADGALIALVPGQAPMTVPIAPPAVPAGVFASGDCSAGNEIMLTFQTLPPQRFRIDDGAPIPTASIAGALVATPCVGLEDGGELRAYIADEMSTWLTMHIDAGPLGDVSDFWPVIDYDVSVTPSLGGAPRALLGLQPMLSYLTITRATLITYENRPYVAPSPIVDVLPQFPQATRGGDIDGDGALDLVSLMIGFDTDGRPTGRELWARIAAELDARPIIGAAALPIHAPCADAYPDLVLYDFNGDARDEIVIIERGCPSSSVVVLEL